MEQDLPDSIRLRGRFADEAKLVHVVELDSPVHAATSQDQLPGVELDWRHCLRVCLEVCQQSACT